MSIYSKALVRLPLAIRLLKKKKKIMTKEIGIPTPTKSLYWEWRGQNLTLGTGDTCLLEKACPASFRDGHEHPLALTAWLFCLFSCLVFEIQSHVRWGSLGLCVYSFSQCGLSM